MSDAFSDLATWLRADTARSAWLDSYRGGFVCRLRDHYGVEAAVGYGVVLGDAVSQAMVVIAARLGLQK